MENYIIWEFKDNFEFEKMLTNNMNEYLNIISQEYNVILEHSYSLIISANKIEQEKSEQIQKLFVLLENLVKSSYSFNSRDLIHMIKELAIDDSNEKINSIYQFYLEKYLILNTHLGSKIYAKTLKQKEYIELLKHSNIVFATGAAGSGKTYLAVAYAIDELKKNRVKKIIISRPVVEAGEKLGFLPGDLKEKVDPYLIPIYDCLDEFLGKENKDKMLDKGIIEIAPLAYMRGRTLDNAIIILDEAQNTTHNQMKMFLTRLGFNSKMIITGDVSQIDLSSSNMSGLLEARCLLKNIKGISFIDFLDIDCMRHPLISKIIRAYEEK